MYVAVALALVLIAVAVQLLKVNRRLTAERLRQEQGEREVLLVAELIEGLEGSDWQRTIQSQLGAIVQRGIGRAAALVAVSDSGALELRASAHAEGEPLWESSMDDPGAHRALEARAPVRSGSEAVFLPLLVEGDVIGLLAVRGGESASPALRVAARVCGIGLHEIRRHRKQATLTNTDGLTGLGNHRHFQQVLGVALGQAYLEGEPLAIILMDIDHFKKVNDSHGHLFGDLVLRELAYVLRRSIPAHALAARYGGEELVVVVQGQAALRSGEVAEQLREAVAATAIMDFTNGVQLNVTVSMGVALYQLGEGKNRLIARADEALYTSKREGRNRVTVSQPDDSTVQAPIA